MADRPCPVPAPTGRSTYGPALAGTASGSAATQRPGVGTQLLASSATGAGLEARRFEMFEAQPEPSPQPESEPLSSQAQPTASTTPWPGALAAAERICVLSDIHGNVYSLEAVLREIRTLGCDRVVVAGDTAAHGPTPCEAVDLIRSLGCLVVRGNTDRYLAEGTAPPPGTRDPEQAVSLEWSRAQLGQDRLQFLGRLPHSVTLPGCLVVHGAPGDDERGIWPETPDAEIEAYGWGGTLLCGHTHRPFQRALSCGEVVNVGSAGWTLDGDPRPSYALLERVGAGPWRTTLRRVDYDHSLPLEELERRQVPWRAAVSHYITTATWRTPARTSP
ncbi:MAG TPA: metallophosphoesterase family protein [Candidatus Nanopelagicaceae bacterium]|nr:metallophosphoesterase family protein [Candidatus Nanopelagicaceae bacterium]